MDEPETADSAGMAIEPAGRMFLKLAHFTVRLSFFQSIPSGVMKSVENLGIWFPSSFKRSRKLFSAMWFLSRVLFRYTKYSKKRKPRYKLQ